MSARDRAIKRQEEADRLFYERLDKSMDVALQDEEIWPLLQWLFYVESGFTLTSFSLDPGQTAFREGQRSVGFALQTTANRVNWAKWQALKAQYERPSARANEPPENEDGDREG